MLGHGLSDLYGVVSTRLEMSPSWISVMQATVDDLLLMTQMFFCWQVFHWSFFFFF